MSKSSRHSMNKASSVTLSDYYEGRVSLSRLFSPAGPAPTDTHDQTRLDTLLAGLDSFDPDLRMTVKLMSRGVDQPWWVQRWLQMVIEREVGGALDPEEASSRFGLRRLFRRCRDGITVKDKVAQRRAYNVLRLSLIWVHSHHQLHPVNLAEESKRLATPYGLRGTKGRALERSAVAPLLRASSLAALKKELLSLWFWIERAQTARADVFTAEKEVGRLVAKASELRQDLATAHSEIQVLQNQAADSAKQIDALSHALEVERNKRINDMCEIKGRVRRLFDSDLSPRLRGACEALNEGPTVVDVALERLDRALELIEEERLWLSSD